MSWAPEVKADESGKFLKNLLRFETKQEAEANIAELKTKWSKVTDTRVVEKTDPVNAKWIGGKLVHVKD